jgi:hypothetical protein
MKKGETSMQENFGVITVDSLVDNKDLRNKLIDRENVIDKVKKLFMIPELLMVSTQQVANYFDVDNNLIRQVFLRNKDEITSDGVQILTAAQISSALHSVTPIRKDRCYTTFDIGEGREVALANAKNRLFSLRAVLRIGLLLRDSEVAKEIRTQLLNVYDDVSVVQRTRHVTEEWDMMIDAIKGMENNDMELSLRAMTKMVQYANRHKLAAEALMVKNTELAASNASLETAN